MKFPRFPRSIRFGVFAGVFLLGNRTYRTWGGGGYFSKIDAYRSVGKPNLPGLRRRRLFFLKLTLIVRLGMQIAFGRVRRKTKPTGPGGENSIEKWTIAARPLARFVGGQVLCAEGRVYSVEVRYLGGVVVPTSHNLVERVEKGIKRALKETDGNILVFLPAVRAAS